MPKPRKRPNKNAKAAQKAVSGSKLLAEKAASQGREERSARSSVVSPRTSTAIKPRPDKKRGG
jgi:hypothetical protein